MTQAVKLTMVALASWAYFAVTAGTVDLEPVLSNSVALYLGAPEYIFLGHRTLLVSLYIYIIIIITITSIRINFPLIILLYFPFDFKFIY
jgi:hypothetical protein